MSSSIRDEAIHNFINFMAARGTDKSAAIGVYSGKVRLVRSNISASIEVPTAVSRAVGASVIRGLTLNSKDDTEWDKICDHMDKWAAKNNKSTGRKKRWITLSQTTKRTNKDWSISWKNNERMTGPKDTNIENSFKTEMSLEVKTAYALAFNGFADTMTGNTVYEHGTEREVDYIKSESSSFSSPATNLQSQKGSYTDISVKKAIKKATDKAIKNVKKNFEHSDIMSVVDIFNGFLTDYLGGEHVLKKDRGSKGINDVLEFIAEITLEDNNVSNPGHLNTAISNSFKQIFGQGDKPTPEFIRLATKYAEISDIKKIENLWTSSDKPSIAIPKLAIANLGKELSKNKKIKLSKELSKKIKTDRKVNRSKIKGKKLRTNKRSSGRIKPFARTAPQKRANEAASGVALKELINAVLPEELLSRMHPPALRNRTGRFRTSAEVTNVLVGPRGGVNVDYTYMKDPYQTFEPGGAQGSTGRDPRRLIGGTIREIAGELMGKKFIKVRRI